MKQEFKANSYWVVIGVKGEEIKETISATKKDSIDKLLATIDYCDSWGSYVKMGCKCIKITPSNTAS